MTFNHIAVIGAGAWGTALAQMLAAQDRPQAVTIYARDKGLAEDINTSHENKKYLTNHKLAEKLTASADLAHVVQHADFIVMATPAQHFATTLTALAPHAKPATPLVNTAKGIFIDSGERLSQISARIAPHLAYGVLSGPSFAHEVAAGLPTAVTLATQAVPMFEAKNWASVLSSPTFRPYLSDDVTGAEYGGALKNVIAIACGIVHGRQLGENARAAVMIRGMAEISRLAAASGGKEHTFLGLAGMGDLTLTCHSMQSRNFSLGAALGQGKTLADITAGRVTVAEGVATAKAVAAEAARLSIDMPICTAVYALLHENAKLDDIIRNLLARDLKTERE